jgi:hypothetical protein
MGGIGALIRQGRCWAQGIAALMSFFRRRRQSDLRDAIALFKAEENIGPDAHVGTILVSHPIQARIEAFDRADERALRKQSMHWGAGSTAWWAGLCGVVVVPIELLPIASWLPSWAPHVVSFLRVLALILMFVAIILLGRRRSWVHWKQARVDAEKVRADVFREIIEAAGREPDRLLQALACFRVAHLDWQRRFYEKRLKELPERWRAERRRALPFRLLGYVLSAGAAILGAVAVLNYIAGHGLPLPYLEVVRQWLVFLDASRWQDGLNATAATLLAFAGARFLTHEDFSNAALYPWARDQLGRIRAEELARAQSAAATGDVLAVLDFRKRVQDILDTEHTVWSGASLPAEPR